MKSTGGHRSLSAVEAAQLMQSGKLTAVALMEDLLARIAEREESVGAWSHIDPAQCLEAARARDREPRRSALHGIPVGIKDIIDTADMPTQYGSPIYESYRPRIDAACVARLREAGAIVMGKTVTVEFAQRHPGKTRNPHNLEHTPGGSSSGSAAAVADFMVPLALGTQTGGSVIRPSAYCGVVGMKPTFNVINRSGVKPVAESLDTVGIMGRSVSDVASALAVLTGEVPPESERSTVVPRIGFCRTPQWPSADAATGAALEDAVSRLGRAGVRIEEIVLPPRFDALFDAHGAINDYESSRALKHERLNFPNDVSRTLMKKLDEADRCTLASYIEGQRCAAECRALLETIWRDCDALLVPAAPGEAPRGIESTGDSVFNRLWTVLHVPAVTLPVFTGPSGLPMGAQLVGRFGCDQALLACARRIQQELA